MNGTITDVLKDCFRLLDIAVTQLERCETREARETLKTLRGGLRIIRSMNEEPLTAEQIKEIQRIFGYDKEDHNG